ncbi:hypothetical protein J0910_11610 [Nocardiopsis sp. CNT-189]|uniref:hypothetical protein n=1 Tax=Nocardiopsis oceanisediminis TaxID=2816862 RepID=UPI003B2F7F46
MAAGARAAARRAARAVPPARPAALARRVLRPCRALLSAPESRTGRGRSASRWTARLR